MLWFHPRVDLLLPWVHSCFVGGCELCERVLSEKETRERDRQRGTMVARALLWLWADLVAATKEKELVRKRKAQKASYGRTNGRGVLL